MARIDELQKMYPQIPREIIVKWEVVADGVKDTEGLDKVSNWSRAAGSYQTYDFDCTLKEVAEKREGRVRPGFYMRPGAFFMKNGQGATLRRHTKSPYEIREIGEGKFGLYEGEEKVDVDIYFPTFKRWADDLVTSSGMPVTNLMGLNRRCFSIHAVRHCEYFARGEQCKFCNFNATQDDVRAIGMYRPPTINLEETVEAYKIIASNVNLIEGRLELGGFTSLEAETKIHYNFVERIASAAPYKPNLTIHTQAMDRKSLQRLKDAGLDTPTFQMEVWDKVLFEEVCPGKAHRDGHARYLEAFQEAVDIYGVGSVGVTFVGGVTLAAPDGHKTWQEARDSHIEGNTWMIKHGVVPCFTNLRLPPGSVYGEDPANREKLPPAEYYLEVGWGHHQAMLETGLYDKMNKFMWCGLDCPAGIYCGEIGMLTLAGDIGTWMSDCIPDEANWIAHFVKSVKTPAKTG